MYGVDCALSLDLPRRTKRWLPKRLLLTMGMAATITWALDSRHDMVSDGRRFRTLNVLDEGNREGLAIKVGTSVTGTRFASVLDQLVAIRGAPPAGTPLW